jgi:digeranylgeranylglycerophospholipid reductase
MVVGDAAAQVKATSGGGVYTGLVCAGHCAKAAIRALERDDLSTKTLSGYHRAWMGDIGDELKKGLLIHRMYGSMTDAQFDEAFELLGREDVLELINSVGDIDYPSNLAWSLLRKEPRLVKYAGKYLRHALAP